MRLDDAQMDQNSVDSWRFLTNIAISTRWFRSKYKRDNVTSELHNSKPQYFSNSWPTVFWWEGIDSKVGDKKEQEDLVVGI